jgi:choline dehydrogenase-like flavoprotein
VKYDVLVVGGGSAGCVLAARLSEDEVRTVCLVEAGPDYGPHAHGGWPQELLDPGGIPEQHQWDPDESPFSPLRARVLGGCSAHNACLLVWDDELVELEPFRDRALHTIAPDPFFYTPDEFSPWFAGVADACETRGIEVAIGPYNIRDGVRWNAAFAYVDPARARSNLTIRGDTLVDRILFEGERAVGVSAGGEIVGADIVVLAAGAVGSPAILLRSGVGPEMELDALGIVLVAPLEGVGANLQDHATVKLVFEPTDELRTATRQRAPVPFSNGLVKTPDLHLLPITARTGDGAHLTVALLRPESRGRVRLRSTDPAVPPEIDHGLLSASADRATLQAGLDLALELADDLRPLGRPVTLSHDERIDTTLGIYFHPVGTCAVVGDDFLVPGFENLYVCDASVLETIPRANTHLVTLALAEKLGSEL